MTFRSFYIHCNKAPGTYAGNSSRGFTALISPVEDDRKCRVSFAFCNKKDQFVKAEGRQVANGSIVAATINKRNLHHALENAARDVCDMLVEDGHFLYTLKYVI